MLGLSNAAIENHGRVALFVSTQPVPFVVMLPRVLETTVLPLMLLGQVAEMPKAAFLTAVLLVTVPLGEEIPLISVEGRDVAGRHAAAAVEFDAVEVIVCSEAVAHNDGKDSEGAVAGGRAFDHATGDEESATGVAVGGDPFDQTALACYENSGGAHTPHRTIENPGSPRALYGWAVVGLYSYSLSYSGTGSGTGRTDSWPDDAEAVQIKRDMVGGNLESP